MDFDDDELLNWTAVKTRLDRRGRGAPYQLATAMRMSPSYLYRKLKAGGPITTLQAAQVREFLGEKHEMAEPIAPFTPARVPVFGVGDQDGRFSMTEPLDRMEPPAGLSLRSPYYLVRQPGSQMEPRILAGELLVVTPNIEAATNRDALIEFTDGSGMIVTYRGRRQGRVFGYRLEPAKEEAFDATKVRAVHAVFGRL